MARKPPLTTSASLAREPERAIMKRVVVLAIVLALWGAGSAWAGELEGVKMPDKATVGGQALVLNGMGLREKLTVDVYVGGLYLEAKTKDGGAAISQDKAKRIVMHFVRDVDKGQLVDTLRDGIKKSADATVAMKSFDKMSAWMRDVKGNDEIVIDYTPGKGTSFAFNGKVAGTIEGIEFMRAIWSIFLGANPADEALKKGMLGK